MQKQHLLPERDIKELRKPPALGIRIRIQFTLWIRIADPDPAWDCRSGSSYLNIGAKRQNSYDQRSFQSQLQTYGKSVLN
jgi:hypothetical protein